MQPSHCGKWVSGFRVSGFRVEGLGRSLKAQHETPNRSEVTVAWCRASTKDEHRAPSPVLLGTSWKRLGKLTAFV